MNIIPRTAKLELITNFDSCIWMGEDLWPTLLLKWPWMTALVWRIEKLATAFREYDVTALGRTQTLCHQFYFSKMVFSKPGERKFCQG